MKYVDYKNLKFIEYYFSQGNFSEVHIIEYAKELYCFKELEMLYDDDIMKNIENFTERNLNKYLLTPKYIIKNNNSTLGYLSKYYNNTKNIISKELDFKEKIILLKNTKKLIEQMHNDYKLIHGDINMKNILYDNLYNIYLIDFDSSLYYNQKLKSLESLSWLATNYLNKYKFDYKIDIYKFNLMTIKLLNDLKKDSELILYLENNNQYNNKNIKKLCKELLLEPENNKKEYSGDYIIDYL